MLVLFSSEEDGDEDEVMTVAGAIGAAATMDASVFVVVARSKAICIGERGAEHVWPQPVKQEA